MLYLRPTAVSPLSGVLLCKVEIQCVVADTWFNHCPFKPFVEASDGNPVGIAGDGGCPTDIIRRTIVTWDNIRSLASW